jgi:hypothetical protein
MLTLNVATALPLDVFRRLMSSVEVLARSMEILLRLTIYYINYANDRYYSLLCSYCCSLFCINVQVFMFVVSYFMYFLLCSCAVPVIDLLAATSAH